MDMIFAGFLLCHWHFVCHPIYITKPASGFIFPLLCFYIIYFRESFIDSVGFNFYTLNLADKSLILLNSRSLFSEALYYIN